MTRKAEALSAADLEAWTRYLRHVQPLPGAHLPIFTAPAAEAQVQPLRPPQGAPAAQSMARPEPAVPSRRTPIAVGVAPPGLDRATWTRFRAGRIAPERTLDLHGMTTANAHVAITALIGGAVMQGIRCVEIITGHGRRNGGEGVLRREVPLWLDDAPLRAVILAVCHPHAANQGALRVLLRRVRT